MSYPFKKTYKPKPFTLQTFLTSWLRRGSYRLPWRTQLMNKARLERGLYKCAHCGGGFKRAEINIDHIQPVIDPLTGFVDWNTFIERLYCGVDGLQILCEPCHQTKTTEENRRR